MQRNRGCEDRKSPNLHDNAITREFCMAKNGDLVLDHPIPIRRAHELQIGQRRCCVNIIG